MKLYEKLFCLEFVKVFRIFDFSENTFLPLQLQTFRLV
jgi:hypothetical protein